MKATTRKRPIGISFLAVLGFIICAGQIVLISYPGIRDIGEWYPIVYGFLTAFKFISLVGVWHMKKWGAEIFLYTLLAKISIQVVVNDFTAMASLDTFLSVVSVIVFLCFYRRMDRNL